MSENRDMEPEPLALLSAGVCALVERRGITFATGRLVHTTQEVGDPLGLLPFLLLDAARIWSEATGSHLGVRVVEDQEAGYLLRAEEPRCPVSIALLAIDMGIEEAISMQELQNVMFEAGLADTASRHRRILRYGGRLAAWSRAVERASQDRLAEAARAESGRTT